MKSGRRLAVALGLSIRRAPFWRDVARMNGFMMLTFLAILVAPWTALADLIRQKEAFPRHQALAFDLERSELERRVPGGRFYSVCQPAIAELLEARPKTRRFSWRFGGPKVCTSPRPVPTPRSSRFDRSGGIS